jgi:hypothetical protein
MVVVPALIPETKPVDALTVAIAVLVLAQVPAPTVDEKVEVLPTQIDCVPESEPADGAAVTVTVMVLEYPVLAPSVAARLKYVVVVNVPAV